MNGKSLNDCVQMSELTDSELAQIGGGNPCAVTWAIIFGVVTIIDRLINKVEANPDSYSSVYDWFATNNPSTGDGSLTRDHYNAM